jgi:hypothetical protein
VLSLNGARPSTCVINSGVNDSILKFSRNENIHASRGTCVWHSRRMPSVPNIQWNKKNVLNHFFIDNLTPEHIIYDGNNPLNGIVAHDIKPEAPRAASYADCTYGQCNRQESRHFVFIFPVPSFPVDGIFFEIESYD